MLGMERQRLLRDPPSAAASKANRGHQEATDEVDGEMARHVSTHFADIEHPLCLPAASTSRQRRDADCSNRQQHVARSQRCRRPCSPDSARWSRRRIYGDADPPYVVYGDTHRRLP
jgi:hypothetical protein